MEPETGGCVITCDEEGIIEHCNIFALRLFGYSFSELFGKNVSMLMPEPYRSQHDSYIKRYLNTKEAKVLDTTRMVVAEKKNKKTLKVQLSLSELSVKGKRVFVALLVPVLSSTVKITTDKAGNVLTCSKNIQHVLGYKKREVIGKNVAMICPEPHRSRHGEYITRYEMTGDAKVLDIARNLNAMSKFGKSVPISLQVTKTEEGYRGKIYPIDHNTEVMITASTDGTIEDVAAKNCKVLFGKSVAKMKGMFVSSLFDAPFQAMQMKRDGRPYPAYLITADGSRLTVEVEANEFDKHDKSYIRFRVAKVKEFDDNRNSSSDSSESSDSSDDDFMCLNPDIEELGFYSMTQVLGVGFCGAVRKAIHKISGMPVAIKSLKRSQFEEVGMRFPPREIDLLHALPGHPNLMRLYDMVQTRSRVYLVQEFIDGMEMFDYIQMKGALPENDAKSLFKQLVDGIAFLHLNGIVHRDVKMENLLLQKDGVLKIIDLGLGAFYNEKQLLSTFCGSADYAAPELYLRQKYHGPPVDAWAIGICLFIMTTSYVPFNKPQQVVDCKVRFPKSVRLSAELTSLMLKILVFSPKKRLTLSQMKEHQWLKNVRTVADDYVHDAELDENIIEDVCSKFGAKRDFVVNGLTEDKCNAVHACYYLLKKKKEIETEKLEKKGIGGLKKSGMVNFQEIPNVEIEQEDENND